MPRYFGFQTLHRMREQLRRDHVQACARMALAARLQREGAMSRHPSGKQEPATVATAAGSTDATVLGSARGRSNDGA